MIQLDLIWHSYAYYHFFQFLVIQSITKEVFIKSRQKPITQNSKPKKKPTFANGRSV
jgi:hypothetical protein